MIPKKKSKLWEIKSEDLIKSYSLNYHKSQNYKLKLGNLRHSTANLLM